MTGQNLLTFSRATCFNTCRKKEHNKYGLGVRRQPSEALRIGSAVHEATDQIQKGVTLVDAIQWIHENYAPLICGGDTQEYVDKMDVECGKVVELVRGWVERWRDDLIEIIKSELSFESFIKRPGNRQPLRKMRHAGKLDGLCLVDDRVLLLERKTTSDKIELGSPYWQRTRIDSQISWYTIASHKIDEFVEGALYDVLRKPSIRRRQNDSVVDYLERLRGDIAERPEFYFARVEIPRTIADLELAQLELWQTAKAIQGAYKSGHHYRNTSACTFPFNCEFLDTCENQTDLSVDPLPNGFVRVDNVHPELENSNASTTKGAAEAAAEDTPIAPHWPKRITNIGTSSAFS